MVFRALIVAGALASALVITTAVEAAPASTTANVNMRAGASTRYPVITVLPAGATVDVVNCSSWCQVNFNGRYGWVSRSYLNFANYYPPAPPPVYSPPVYYPPAPPPPPPIYQPPVLYPPPPTLASCWSPRWGECNAWYNGQPWWYVNGRWINAYSSPPPTGITLRFGFGLGS